MPCNKFYETMKNIKVIAILIFYPGNSEYECQPFSIIKHKMVVELFTSVNKLDFNIGN